MPGAAVVYAWIAIDLEPPLSLSRRHSCSLRLFLVCRLPGCCMLGSDDQHGECGSSENTLGHAAHRPTLQPATSMGGQSNAVAPSKDASSIGIFPIFRDVDDSLCRIGLQRHRPGNCYLEFCRDALAQMLCYRCQVDLRFVEQVFFRRRVENLIWQGLAFDHP